MKLLDGQEVGEPKKAEIRMGQHEEFTKPPANFSQQMLI